MKQCSITGRPLNIDAEVVIIPILISKDTIYHINAHDNVHPFPIAINGVYNGDRLENMFDIDTKDKKTTALLALISDVLGYKATWEDFISSEGEEVLFRVIGFTCCCRQNAVLKHAGVSFGFTCCYNEGSPIAGEQSWSQ